MNLCIYHKNCPDGFTSAWLVHHALEGRVELHGASYGDPLPEVSKDDNVWVVDFSYPMEQMVELASKVNEVHWWDHHQSAITDAGRYSAEVGAWPDNLNSMLSEKSSGAGITRLMLTPELFKVFDEPTMRRLKWIVDRVEDRDLWKFALDGTAEVFSYLSALDHTVEAWDRLLTTPAETILDRGSAISMFRNQMVDRIASNAWWSMVAGFRVPTVNSPYAFGSDVCHLLCEQYPEAPFTAYFYDTATERKWGLRSSDDGEDVAVIAERHGGGGHKHASGFVEPLLIVKEMCV